MASNAENIVNHRTALPVAMPVRNDISIWSVLKNSMGKELSKITMPVELNEPLSFLQRLCEYMEYGQLLSVAANQTDPLDRMKYVAAFAVSALACNCERLGKPFNPLLGETYELQRDGYRIICEQVSHHPPISAFHAESPDFKFHGSIQPKMKFWGKSAEIQPKGILTLELLPYKEVYTWSNVNCCVHNIIVGKLWIEQYGTMEIVNVTTGYKAVINFKTSGWSSKDLHRVEGFIQNKNKKSLLFLYGKWTHFLKCADIRAYEDYAKDNPHKGKNAEKISNEEPSNTPKKVFSKLNTLKMSSFRSLSIQETEDAETILDGELTRSDSTYSLNIPGSILLWTANPRPENTAEFYQFTKFAMQLNEIEPDMNPPITLCPTDSRLRPDIRKLEQGDIEGAAIEKERLEEKQRDFKKHKKSTNLNKWTPRWFKYGLNELTNHEDWIYVGGYWERKYNSLSIF